MKIKTSADWKFRGCRPYIPIEGKKDSEIAYYFLTDWYKATVPGGIHFDLFNAGEILNPYYEKNSLGCEWTEHRWWLYDAEIFIAEKTCRKKELVFAGLDYKCEVFINGKSYGQHENMFTEKRIDITDIKEDKIHVRVLFEGVTPELGQYGKTSDTRTQKSRFGYLWDFGTRLVNIGMWQDVYVEYTDEIRLFESKIYTDFDEKGIIDIDLQFEGETKDDVLIKITSPDGETVAEKNIAFNNHITEKFEIENPKLWYPNGMGEQPLYKINISCANETYEYKTGIRSLRFKRNPGAPEDSIPYTVVINGKDVYLKGNNKVPLDHLYGNVSYDWYEWVVKSLVNENVNIVRVWGGGIIETEEFYNLCDENGIMIWQDFIQSSSGTENAPAEDEEFLKKLKAASEAAVKEKRNHVSLTVWTGGNELAEEGDIPVTYENKNIAMLKKITDEFDPQRTFLPSTPSGPTYRVVFEREDNHDVHAPWEYIPEYYEDFNRVKLLLHSEFGISGPAANTKLFLKENVAAIGKCNSNTHHAEYWYHSMERDIKNFGDFDSTDEYVPYGQWIQALGLRYVIESERRLAPYACGSMVWQINEPWPNTDCTNLMDYFGTPKMAYYWVKKAFSDCNVSLKFKGVYFEKEIEAEIHALGDMPVCDEEFTARVYNEKGDVLKEYNLNVKELPVKINVPFERENQMLMVRLTHKGTDKDYFFSSDKEHFFRPSRKFEKADIEYEISKLAGDGIVKTATAKIKNIGSVPAYFVNPKDKNHSYAILCSDAFFTLMPGEEKEITMSVRERTGLFFEKVDTKPEIVFDCLNS